MIGAVCETFHCLPDVALRQNPNLVIPVMEARLAREAKAQYEIDASKMTLSMAKMWKELTDGESG